MRTIIAERKAIDLEQFKMRSAVEADYHTFISESAAICEPDNPVPVIVYLELNGHLDASPLVAALNRIRYEENTRTNGLPTRSRIFGYRPRNTTRNDFCSSTSLATEQPEEHAIVCQYAADVARYYAQMNPNLYETHDGITQQKVEAEYRIKDAPFTSGIINKNNPLRYHFDSGNFTDVWSCMLVFKGNGVSGGYLAVPEYDCGFALNDNSLLMFDGQRVLHGVTPIRKDRPDSYRYSIVYYSLKQMWNCLPLGQELNRIRTLKTTREAKRVDDHRDKL